MHFGAEETFSFEVSRVSSVAARQQRVLTAGVSIPAAHSLCPPASSHCPLRSPPPALQPPVCPAQTAAWSLNVTPGRTPSPHTQESAQAFQLNTPRPHSNGFPWAVPAWPCLQMSPSPGRSCRGSARSGNERRLRAAISSVSRESAGQGCSFPEGGNTAQTRNLAHKPRTLLPQPRLDSGPCAPDRTNLPNPPGAAAAQTLQRERMTAALCVPILQRERITAALCIPTSCKEQDGGSGWRDMSPWC